MIDKAKFTIPHTALPTALHDDPDQYLYGDLLGGGQLLPRKKFRVDPHGRKFWLLVGPGDAIKIAVELDEDDQLIATSIEVNFPKLVYGHNGVALDETRMLLALSRLEEHLAAAFDSPELARGLVPGLVETDTEDADVPYWTMLEIAAHRSDLELVLFRAFCNATHPCSHKRLVSADESVRFGTKRSKTAISIYRKRKEMEAKHGEENVAGDDEDDVLRVEVILKSDHLVKHFRSLGSETVQFRKIDGLPRLIAFAWDDLMRVHQALVARFKGAFSDAAPSKDKTDQVGRFIAEAFGRFDKSEDSSVHEWLDLFGEVSGAAKNRMARIRGACMQQLERSRLGSQSFADWFGDDAYRWQPAVWIPAKERATSPVRQFPGFSDAVIQAYAPDGFSQALPSFLR